MGFLPPGLVRRVPRLPLPIAAPLHRAAQATDPTAAHADLMRAAEATVALLGAVTLLDAAAGGRPLTLLPERTAPPLGLGWWRRVIDGLAHRTRTPTLPALRALRADAGRWAVADAAMGLLAEAPATTGLDPLDAPRELPRRAEALTRLLAELPELAGTALLQVAHHAAGDAVRVRPLIGPTPRDLLTLDWAHPPPAGEVALLDLGSQRWVGLGPLYRWDDGALRVHSGTAAEGDGLQAAWDPVAPADGPLTARVDTPTWLRERLGTAWGLARGQVHLAPQAHAALSAGVQDLHSPSDALVAAALAPPTPAKAAPPPARSRWTSPWLVVALLALVAATAWFALSAQQAPEAVGPLVPAPPADAGPKR